MLAGSPPPARADQPATLREELSEGELRVLRYLLSNLSAPEIGRELYLSFHTVKTHIRHIYAKLEVHRRGRARPPAGAPGAVLSASAPDANHPRRLRPARLPARDACSSMSFGLWRPMLQPRDEPVHLSDSRPETHQHLAPAGANCCHSLLLDPDATIGNDLHKRLFLLVTGRGE